MDFKLPETIWQADSLKEIGEMPVGRLILIVTPHYLTAVGIMLAGGASLVWGLVAFKKLVGG